MLVGHHCMFNVKSWSKSRATCAVQQSMKNKEPYRERIRITECVRHYWRESTALWPLRDSFSTLTQGHPVLHSCLSIKCCHCALWQPDDNNTHSQKSHCFFYLTQGLPFSYAFFLCVCFLHYNPRWPQAVLQGRRRCVWLWSVAQRNERCLDWEDRYTSTNVRCLFSLFFVCVLQSCERVVSTRHKI